MYIGDDMGKKHYCPKHGKPIIMNLILEVGPALITELIIEVKNNHNLSSMCCKCISEYNREKQRSLNMIEKAIYEHDYGPDPSSTYKTDCGWIRASDKKETKFCPECGRVIRYMKKKKE